MLAIGGAAGAASFTHVHDVAAAHGQSGWLAWADAVVLELMSIASGLEIRRRHRAHTSIRFPAFVLAFAVALSIAAQVVESEASAIGWIAAALPALGFLVMVKIALARTDTATEKADDAVLTDDVPAPLNLKPAVGTHREASNTLLLKRREILSRTGANTSRFDHSSTVTLDPIFRRPRESYVVVPASLLVEVDVGIQDLPMPKIAALGLRQLRLISGVVPVPGDDLQHGLDDLVGIAVREQELRSGFTT